MYLLWLGLRKMHGSFFMFQSVMFISHGTSSVLLDALIRPPLGPKVEGSAALRVA
jgi:hypothetical protein